MSHENKKSLIFQVFERMSSYLCIGESKHEAKQNGSIRNKIFSWGTFKTYTQISCQFVIWAKRRYDFCDIDQARPFAGEFLKDMIDRDLSPYSIRTAASALAKLYGCKSTDFGVVFPTRKRENITRSRKDAVRDKGFSASRNETLIAFGECTGLRRSELSCLTGDKLIPQADGSYCIRVDKGTKGGRKRVAMVIGPPEQVAIVVDAMKQAGKEKVFSRINSHADIHAMRAVYASRIYKSLVGDRDQCEQIRFWNQESRSYEGDVYWCRGDQRGLWFDKSAMLAASKALGHSRISVVGEHYLYNLRQEDL